MTSKPEASTQGSLWHGIPPERGTENEYSTTTPKDGVLPGIIPPRERDHKNDTSHTGTCKNNELLFIIVAQYCYYFSVMFGMTSILYVSDSSTIG